MSRSRAIMRECGDRGWGTAGRVSKFQQSNENLSYNEAAADMFLNWVYRILYERDHPDSGFKNRSWDPAKRDEFEVPCNQVEEGCMDSSNPGDVLFAAMNGWMTTIFQ